MLIGQTMVVAVQSGSATTTLYTPWISSWGTSAVFSYEIMAIGGNAASPPSFVAKLQTKNTEDADPSASTVIATDSTRTTASTFSFPTSNNIKELVRLQFNLTTTAAVGFAHVRALNPSWQTN